ncbi:hypothetical protein [uncultured virus]|uniref:Uncharacterized protein n=1 Tax=uncultured virus TaxID=340016 RepID=A0A218MNC7_9VIRU|nr:hypothetical protein [uncultured virus]
MELLTVTYCPYCKSWIDVESMLTTEKLKEMQFYLTCPECNKTFSTFAKTVIKVNVSSIEDRIEQEKDSLLFWEKANMRDKAFKNERIDERKKRIQELESIKERNDKVEE